MKLFESFAALVLAFLFMNQKQRQAPAPQPLPNRRPYVIEYGIPIPTENFCRDGIWIEHSGVTTLRIADFPHQILPSGGASCILSASEMFAVVVNWDPEPVDNTTHIYFYRCADGKQIFHSEGPDFTENKQGYRYGAFIGNYDWELAVPGKYHAKVVTKYGTDIIKFEVI